MPRGRARWLLLGVVHLACPHPSTDNSTPAPEAGATSASIPAQLQPRADVAIDPLSDDGACVLGYQGTVLDFGDPSLRTRFGPRFVAAPVEVIEREGATWARIRAKSLSVDFYLTPTPPGAEPADAGATSFLEARVRGGAAKTVAFYVNGKLAGSASVVKGEARILSFKGPGADTVPGANELLLRFSGAPRATTDPLAEVDWVHIGRGEPDPKYSAPLRNETKVSATLHGKALRALSLRPGGYARCAGFIPIGSRVEAVLGVLGPGSGDAEVRLVRDRVPPVVLGSVHVAGADADGKAVSFPVGDVGSGPGTLGAIELHAVRSTAGARLLFGEPKLVVDRPPAEVRPPPARGVVLVVLGDTATRSLELYGGTRAMPELARLAKRGVVFDAHRATTGLEGGSFASMITGLLPRDHAVDDADARLPASITTLADAARQAGITTAMFTAVPTTGAAFGFERGWSTFEAMGPAESATAVSLVDRAAAWIGEHKGERFLVVVHARAGHPPWDVTGDELKRLEPQNYTGGLDARHAAELLARASASPGSFRFGDADRARAWAMYDVAMAAHDAALGRLLTAIDGAGRGGDTALMVTGDVGVDEAARVPFARTGPLGEDTLWTPLVIDLPGGSYAGSHVATPTTGQDIARTVLGELGLAAPVGFGGIDLVDLAGGRVPTFARPLMATLAERFALRWGSFADTGQRDHETRLCDLSLEPACVSDVRASYPLAASLLHAATFDALVGGPARPPREPATIDPATASSLRAWGR
jgi:arylsulfatase A-like enzyme